MRAASDKKQDPDQHQSKIRELLRLKIEKGRRRSHWRRRALKRAVVQWYQIRFILKRNRIRIRNLIEVKLCAYNHEKLLMFILSELLQQKTVI
jgi:hypothetical protein